MKQNITVIEIDIHNKFDFSDSILHCVAVNIQGACRLCYIFGTNDIGIKATGIVGTIFSVIFDRLGRYARRRG